MVDEYKPQCTVTVTLKTNGTEFIIHLDSEDPNEISKLLTNAARTLEALCAHVVRKD